MKSNANLKLQQSALRGRNAISVGLVMAIWAILPLVFNKGYFNISTAKAVSLWAICLVAALSAITVCLILPVKHQKASWFVYSLIIFGGFGFLSALLSNYGYIAWFGEDTRYDGFFTLICYVLIAVIVSQWYSFQAWHAYVLTAVMFCLSLIGVLQILRYNPLFLYPQDFNLYITHFLSLLGNFNIVSTFAQCVVIFLAALFVFNKQNTSQPIYLFGCCCAFVLQLIANSSAGWLGICSGFIIMAPFALKQRNRAKFYAKTVLTLSIIGFVFFIFMPLCNIPPEDKVSPVLAAIFFVSAIMSLIILIILQLCPTLLLNESRFTCNAIFIVIVLCIVICFCTIMVLGTTPQMGVIYQIRQILLGNLDDNFMSFRGFIWKNALQCISARPLLGSGPDTFGQVFSEKYAQASIDIIGTLADKAHNEYLQYLVCNGVLGLASYMAVILLALNKWRENVIKMENPEMIAAGFVVIGYIVQAFFTFSSPISSPFFWVMLGICAKSVVKSE